uniref:Endosulphine n=1 Tax=Fagus sylvatica TaxID=28930 RepID=A0A2N9J5V3_FAGSY
MSGANIEDIKEQELTDNTLKNQVDVDSSVDDLTGLDNNEENPMPSPQQEEEIVRKKYGGLLPRKPPLISKDHERAFFDSADWALGKQGAQKPKGPLEALRPKLQFSVCHHFNNALSPSSSCLYYTHQPTPHQQVRSRRSAYAPADDGGEVDGSNNHTISSEDQSCTLDGSDNNNDTSSDGGNNNKIASDDQKCHE